MVGPVSKVSVKLNNLNHTFPGDVDMLLVGPGGQKFIILSDALGTSDWVNTTYTLEDAAAALVPSSGAVVSGSFRPTNYTTGDVFPAPAPAAPFQNPATAGSATFASIFNGTDPNGTWRLFVVDDAGGDLGNIAGGWALSITTEVPVCETVASVNLTNATVSKPNLWPPNHQMQDVAVNYSTGTACSTCTLSVSSNEPVDGTGDGDTSPDWEVLSDHAVRLRAERAGNGSGRIYTITITCLNGHGTDTASVQVYVSHNNKPIAGADFKLSSPFDSHGPLWGLPTARWAFDGLSAASHGPAPPRPFRSGRRTTT
jgi:subtilisin-like proprotein convertase family protein